MIEIPCEQGSPEWIAARIGIPTASEFDRIVTPKGAPSRSQDRYIHQLLAEEMLDAALDTYISEWMDRGMELEPQAFKFYEFERDVTVRKVGFITTDDGRAGCSPDGLVGEDGGLEIKCPSPQVHVANMLEMPTTYHAQVQGSLWVTGRKWWDLLSFHPDLPSALVRIERDEAWISAFEKHLGAFLVRLEEYRERLKGER